MNLEGLQTLVKDELGLAALPKAKDRFIEDLDVSSLSMVELMTAIEEEYDVRIPMEEIHLIQTYGALVDRIKRG